MHRQQAEEAQAKRDKACNAVKSAEAEMKALQVQVEASTEKYEAIMAFAVEKEESAKNRLITTQVQKEDCLAKQQAAKAANEMAKIQAKPKRKWDCSQNFCRMVTVDVILSVPGDCEIWTVERASSWRTEAATARSDAAEVMTNMKKMNAKIKAFETIIRELTRSCIITR